MKMESTVMEASEHEMFGNLLTGKEAHRNDLIDGCDLQESSRDNTTAERTKKSNGEGSKALNDDILCGKNGLAALVTLFEGVELEARGDEHEKLNFVLKKYESWAHRLFPRLHFEDVIEKIEELGCKKKVRRQTHSLIQSKLASKENLVEAENQN